MTPSQPERQTHSSWMIALIIGGLVVWGGYLALGAVLYDLDLRKGYIVFGMVALFLSVWGLLLYSRAGKLRREASKPGLKKK